MRLQPETNSYTAGTEHPRRGPAGRRVTLAGPELAVRGAGTAQGARARLVHTLLRVREIHAAAKLVRSIIGAHCRHWQVY